MSRKPRAMRPGSPVPRPSPTSCSARSVTASMIPTAPKSMNHSVPSASTRMLPGCGSAWNVPLSNIALRNTRSSRSASTARNAAPVDGGGVGDRDSPHALEHEDGVGRHAAPHLGHGDALDVGVGDRGMERAAVRGLLDVVEFLADGRTSSSDTCTSRGARAASERRSAIRLAQRRTAASRATPTSTSGLRTLTTTSSPSNVCATCVWPMEAAASGSSENEANALSAGRPSSRSRTACTCAAGTGLTLDWRSLRG